MQIEKIQNELETIEAETGLDADELFLKLIKQLKESEKYTQLKKLTEACSKLRDSLLE